MEYYNKLDYGINHSNTCFSLKISMATIAFRWRKDTHNYTQPIAFRWSKDTHNLWTLPVCVNPSVHP